MKAYLVVLCAALAACPLPGRAEASAAESYPIARTDLRVRDPFIVTDFAHDRYLLVSTVYAMPGEKGDRWGNTACDVQVYVSQDLERFSEPKRVLTLDPALGTTAVWAPEMHCWRGTWYLFATLTMTKDAWPIKPMPSGRGKLGGLQPRGTWIFASSSPLGPFKPVADRSVTPREWMCLDGTFYAEGDRPYTVFCHEWCQTGDGRMMLAPLSDDLKTMVGEPKELFVASSVGTPNYVTDGPFLYRSAKSGRLFMLWSNGSPTGYAVYVKESTTGRIAGPWKNAGKLFASDGGHAMLFRLLDGSLALSLHRPNKSPRERAAFFAVRDEGDALRLGGEIGAAQALAVTTARFPDADVVTVDDVERVTYAPDGTYVSDNETWTKILTEKGRRGESVVEMSYSKRYGEGSVEYVGAIGADGVERKIDVSSTTRESTDNGSMGANIYDPLDRRIVCTVPGLKIGETIHVRTRRRALKPRCENAWSDLSLLEWDRPILRATYEVTAPAARPLKKIAIRHPLGNVTTATRKNADGSTVHTFTVTNAPQAFPEPDMPPLYTQVQCVRVSTSSDWPEISRWYAALSEPHLAHMNAAMSNTVAKLAAAAGTNRLARLRALFRFVSQEVRYMGLTMEDTSPGYAPHDVDVTFDNRYGVCRDKAALLVAMLRLDGFRAFPVLIQVGAKLDDEVPQPFFNHAIVAVERAGRPHDYVLMDPTNENAKELLPPYLADMSYIVCRAEGDTLRRTPVVAPEKNRLGILSTGTLASDGSLFLESAFSFDGINDTIFRAAFARKTPDERVRLCERLVRRVLPGASLAHCAIEPADMRDTERPVRARLGVRVPEVLLKGRTRTEFAVPFLGGAFGAANWLLMGNTSLDKRRYPLVIDSTACVDERFEADVSSLGRALDIPSEASVSGGYAYRRRYAVTNGTLVASRALTLSQVEFSPKQYLEIREGVKEAEAADRPAVVFAVDPRAEADVSTRFAETETTVLSDRSWTTTNTFEKEILTYQGKKGSAELKFAYHPDVEKIEILSATVANPGRIAHVTKKEINVMDCGWAAAAPRYPAGKLLIVNLPSVEIGSVVTVTAVRTVTNATASFCCSYDFDAHDPLARRRVRVNDWRREVVRPARLPREPGQPSAALWRDRVTITSNTYAEAAAILKPAADIAAIDPFEAGVLEEKMRDAAPSEILRAIRDFVAKYVKVAGPGVWEMPLDRHLTAPETVLAERYGSRLDVARLRCALLKGAGFEAELVFSAANGDDDPVLRRRLLEVHPDIRRFATPLVRVRVSEGGFLGFGGTTATHYLGGENQYAELGATALEGSDAFDPATGAFEIVRASAKSLETATAEHNVIRVRENGAVDMDVTDTYAGAAVAGFRKTYEELLPEDRQRRYLAILGGIAEAAVATGELETDTRAYPGVRSFRCHVPDYATVSRDAITLVLPPFASSMPTYAGGARQTPFAVAASERETDAVTVRFPEGYTELEHLPESFAFADPDDPSAVWMTQRVTHAVTNGVLEVTIAREIYRRAESAHAADRIELVKDRHRIAAARANRTLVVRRAAK